MEVRIIGTGVFKWIFQSVARRARQTAAMAMANESDNGIIGFPNIHLNE